MCVPVQNPPRPANGCFAKTWISTLEFLRLFRKGDVLPSRAAGWRSLSRFACQQRGCGKIEMWIKAETCPDCEKRPRRAFIWCFYIRSRVWSGTPPHLNARLFLDSHSHDPHVNTLMLILHPLFTHSPSPHTHTHTCRPPMDVHAHSCTSPAWH